MKKITFPISTQLLMLLLAVFGCILPTFAAENPDITALFGRYRLNGTCTLTDITVPAETDYDVVLLPGDNDNEVKIIGLLGYGGQSVVVYNREEGTLSSKLIAADPESEPQFYGEIMFANACGMLMGQLTTPLTLTVSGSNEAITLTGTSNANAVIMDFASENQGTAEYATGYTLTKVTCDQPVSAAIGTFDFTARDLDPMFTLVEQASENFKFTVQQKEGSENTLVLNGLFGMDDVTVEGEYMPEAGIIILPKAKELTNGMFFGVNPENEMGLMDPNGQPFFFVENGQLTTPSMFTLDNGADMEMGMPLVFSFIGGTAKKQTDGTGIQSVDNSSIKVISLSGALHIETADATAIRVYNAQGAIVATANASAASFNGLSTGIYIVKIGDRNVKVAVK